jgi:hypothetical protein
LGIKVTNIYISGNKDYNTEHKKYSKGKEKDKRKEKGRKNKNMYCKLN